MRELNNKIQNQIPVLHYNSEGDIVLKTYTQEQNAEKVKFNNFIQEIQKALDKAFQNAEYDDLEYIVTQAEKIK